MLQEQFVAALNNEFRDITFKNGEFGPEHTWKKEDELNCNFSIPAFSPTHGWWEKVDPTHFTQEDFAGSPFHITSLENAFKIITSGGIIPGPGAHKRFGNAASVIYVGFPDFSRNPCSVYGSVSFKMDLKALLGQNPEFYYRYTMQYQYELSHLFLVSDNKILPTDIALLEFNPPDVAWKIEDEKVHFRKKDDFEFIEFAILKNNKEDVIPVDSIESIVFQKKHESSSLGSDRFKWNMSQYYLILALVLHYDGNIPPKILGKFGPITDIKALKRCAAELLENFDDDDPVRTRCLGLPNPFKGIHAFIEQTIVEVCQRLGEYVANEANQEDVHNFDSAISFLKLRQPWILPHVKAHVDELFSGLVKTHKELFSEQIK